MLATVMVHMMLFSALDYAPLASTPVRNIGARSHNLFVQLEPVSPGLCQAPQTVDVRLEASFDGVNWATFGPVLEQIGTGLTALVATSGAFPWIRGHVRAFDSAECRLTAWYSATVGESVNLIVPPGQRPILVSVSNDTTGNSRLYRIRDGGTSDVLTIYVRGPANTPVYEEGIRNGEPFERYLGLTNQSGVLQYTEQVSVPGTYDTHIRVGGGRGPLRLLREVTTW